MDFSVKAILRGAEKVAAYVAAAAIGDCAGGYVGGCYSRGVDIITNDLDIKYPQYTKEGRKYLQVYRSGGTRQLSGAEKRRVKKAMKGGK